MIGLVLHAWSWRVFGGAFSRDPTTRVMLDALDMGIAISRLRALRRQMEST